MARKRIGILTGGGDVPGLNSVIKSVVYRGEELGCEVIGIRRGWEGLTHVNLNDPASKARYVLPLNRDNMRAIDRTGGTFLHTSRTNPSKIKKLPAALQGQKFEGKESTKNGVTTTVWVDDKLHFPIKSQTSDGSSFELSNIKEGEQPASLFDPPADYRKIDLGGMMGGRTPQ